MRIFETIVELVFIIAFLITGTVIAQSYGATGWWGFGAGLVASFVCYIKDSARDKA